jgi:hypothetical protein
LCAYTCKLAHSSGDDTMPVKPNQNSNAQHMRSNAIFSNGRYMQSNATLSNERNVQSDTDLSDRRRLEHPSPLRRLGLESERRERGANGKALRDKFSVLNGWARDPTPAHGDSVAMPRPLLVCKSL